KCRLTKPEASRAPDRPGDGIGQMFRGSAPQTPQADAAKALPAPDEADRRNPPGEPSGLRHIHTAR
ncbi:MAG TPA: hypothetical protein PK640_17050, partial [Verrucomicrobiota bacterium]|nr:hypothetical protein [Verrucomicrobiota bacterium]